MAHLWLDSDVFIQAKNFWYGFDFAPEFWVFIDQKVAEGQIRSSTLVYGELTEDFEDELAVWARDRRDSGLFVPPDEEVQTMASIIINLGTRKL